MKRFLVLLTDSCNIGYTVVGSFDSLYEVVTALPQADIPYVDILDMEERVWWDAAWQYIDGRNVLRITKRGE